MTSHKTACLSLYTQEKRPPTIEPLQWLNIACSKSIYCRDSDTSTVYLTTVTVPAEAHTPNQILLFPSPDVLLRKHMQRPALHPDCGREPGNDFGRPYYGPETYFYDSEVLSTQNVMLANKASFTACHTGPSHATPANDHDKNKLR